MVDGLVDETSGGDLKFVSQIPGSGCSMSPSARSWSALPPGKPRGLVVPGAELEPRDVDPCTRPTAALLLFRHLFVPLSVVHYNFVSILMTVECVDHYNTLNQDSLEGALCYFTSIQILLSCPPTNRLLACLNILEGRHFPY